MLFVIVPSLTWATVCFLYITFGFGWENLIYLLPHEIAGFVLFVISPFFVFVIFFTHSKLPTGDRGVAEQMRKQGVLMKEISGKVDKVMDGTLGTRKIMMDAMRAHKSALDKFSGAIEHQNSGMVEIDTKLSLALRRDQEKLEKIDPKDVNQMAALVGLINVALTDLSVSATQIIVSLMEEEGREKEEVKEFIGGMVDIYSSGDKNVFFRGLKKLVSESPEHIETLKRLSAKSPEVKRDLSKILRETREIISMVSRCDKDNLIRIVFEGGDLWELNEKLKLKFEPDGAAKA
jgi:hypothetical protein